jgi:hypothetical protein
LCETSRACGERVTCRRLVELRPKQGEESVPRARCGRTGGEVGEQREAFGLTEDRLGLVIGARPNDAVTEEVELRAIIGAGGRGRMHE